MMKRSLVALAVASAVSFSAQAADVSGFADIQMKADNEEYTFGAAGEVDFSATQDGVTVRMDVDVNLAGNNRQQVNPLVGHDTDNDNVEDMWDTTSTDAAVIEQAFFAAPVASNVTLVGGVFNNPIGMEGQDAVDLSTVTNGQIYGIFDNQTALYGNNVAGLAAAVDAGMAKVTVGFLNDIGHNKDSKGKSVNSLALVVNAPIMEGLDVELGHVTQEAGAGAVTDINLTGKVAGVGLGVEYMMAEKAVDSAIGVTVGYEVMPALDVTLRYDTVAYEAAAAPAVSKKDSTSTTLALKYGMAKNLDVKAEYRSDDNGTNTDSSGVVGFVAKF
ncbi:MAG: porin [Gammaproteobacteria bacterium]|nr:porin [Gammaproteobacteria bacterium]